jgi:hypothetical protein
MRIALSFLVGWLVLGPVAACDDGDGVDGDADVDGDVDLDADGDRDGDDAADAEADAEPDGEGRPPCMEASAECRDAACHEPPFDVGCIGGTLVGPSGAPLAGAAAVACPSTERRCFFGESDATGFFTIAVATAGTDYLALYFPSDTLITPFCRVTTLCDGEVGLCEPFVLYPSPVTGTSVPGMGETLPSDLRIEAEDGGAVVLPAGAEVQLPIGAEEWIALTRYPLDENVPCFIDPGNLPAALYAVTPNDAIIMQPGTFADPVLVPATIDLPNDAGLAAGSELDVYVVGGAHGLSVEAPEGEWRAWTTASVTADGLRIQTAPGEGLGYLTWFGLYPR